MTPVSEVIQNAMVIIDDIRLDSMIQENPALFYRKMQQYVDLALPLMSRPPELYDCVTAEYEPCTFADYEWVSTTDSMTQQTEVDTGKIGYDLCVVSQRSADGTELDTYSDFVYDSETGIVTFGVQTAAGINYEIDFCSDGSFSDLTPTMIRLFALAIAIVWDERFNHNWLNLQPKIKDSSFNTVNEANYTEKLTIRMKENRQSFNDELRKYEQDNAYNYILPKFGRNRDLI